MNISSTITSTGSVFPSRVIKNSFFESRSFFTKDGLPIEKPSKEIVEKLEAISGIKERRYIAEDKDSSDLLYEASIVAIAKSGLDKNKLDAIIVAHNAGNMLAGKHGEFQTVPNLGAMLKHKLNIENHECEAFDILFGCPGWVQGVILAHRMIQMGEAKHVLICGVEVASRFIDIYDMDSMLLGDGCGAMILSANSNDHKGILSTATFSHANIDLNYIYWGESSNPNATGAYFKMNGKDVYRYATTYVPQVIKKALDKANCTPNDIDLFFFHQANAKMLNAIAANLMKLYDLQDTDYEKKIPSNIAITGNTSVATVPTLLDMVMNGKIEGFEIKKGQKIVLTSVGAGMHCNAIVYEF